MIGRDLHTLPLVYVAGPYTHPDPVENTNTACHIASRILDTELASALVPHASLVWNLAAPRPLGDWYAIDISHLARCDAVYRFPGVSPGADKEVEFAQSRGLPVFTEWRDLMRWLLDKSYERQNAGVYTPPQHSTTYAPEPKCELCHSPREAHTLVCPS